MSKRFSNSLELACPPFRKTFLFKKPLEENILSVAGAENIARIGLYLYEKLIDETEYRDMANHLWKIKTLPYTSLLILRFTSFYVMDLLRVIHSGRRCDTCKDLLGIDLVGSNDY